MILAVDVGYLDNTARAAGATFHDWKDDAIHEKFAVDVASVEEYVPGQFYRRELPCIQQVIALVRDPIDCIVIDGHVFLGQSRAPGLGAILWEKLHGAVPVIGVAKSSFAGTPEEAKLFRGTSARPLYISAMGMTTLDAKLRILEMKGAHRMPDILKLVDQLSRAKTTKADI